MKIVMIHGQSHKGISYRLGRIFAENLEKEENITEFFLPRDMPEFCCGCLNCMSKGAEYCPHYTYMKPITEAIDRSDVLIFTTPVYCLRTTGAMKALLDHYFVQWIAHRPKAEMYKKKAVIISVGAGAGMRKAIGDIKVSMAYWGISAIYTYGLRGMALSWEGIEEMRREKIGKSLYTMAERVKKNKGKRVLIRRKFMFLAMRMMQKKGSGGSQTDRDYWEEMGWLGEKRPWKQKATGYETKGQLCD